MMTQKSLISNLAHASKALLAAVVIAGLTPMIAHAQDAAATPPAAAAATPAPVVAATPEAAPAAAATSTKASKSAARHNIAVVDLQYLVATSKAGNSIREQLDKQRKVYGSQIDKQEADLRKAEETLAGQQATLSKDDFMKKRKEFADKVNEAQRTVQERRVSFDKAYAGALEKLREQIVKIVADIAGKNDIALVLNRQEVVLVDSKMDITKEVLTTLDQKVTSIPVNIK